MNHVESVILSQTQSKEIRSTELIQELWSGYGQLLRIKTDKTSVILKYIQFPDIMKHPRGWNSKLSHNRKVKSYQVELNWYQNNRSSSPSWYIPKYIASGEIDKGQYLLLEDLSVLGFSQRQSITWDEVQMCIKWLAHFHGKHMNDKADGLWKVGTYWHLDTRPEELEELGDKQLKSFAAEIDLKLNSSKFKTLVHGDAKLANFLFDGSKVSAVDFQYIGGGVGVKDLAYFLSSIYSEDELFLNEKSCLDYYFHELRLATQLDNFDELETDWRELYSYAWCDFYRFLMGWSPDHYKINSYIKQMKEKVLSEISR